MPRRCILPVALALVLLLAGYGPAQDAQTAAPAPTTAPQAEAVTQASPGAETPPASQQAPAFEAAAKYAAMIFTGPADGALSSSSDDLKYVRMLLEDPMVGAFRVDEVRLAQGDAGTPAELAAAVKERESGASLAFFYLAGTVSGSALDGDFLAQLPGRTKILIEDGTTPADTDAKPSLAVKVESGSDGAGAIAFAFSGAAASEKSPASMLLSAMRGNADINRDRKVTIGELAASLSESAAVRPEYVLGSLESQVIFTYHTMAEIAGSLGADKALELAAKYLGQERWVESLLILREIRDDKVSDPEYRRVSEAGQLQLALEGRYSKGMREDNESRSVKSGLDLIADMLMLCNLYYVTDVDNRDLFAGGARNLELLLSNSRLARLLAPDASESAVAEFTAFLKESVGHVYEQETLTENDFQMRVKRVIMEDEATLKLKPGVIVTEFMYGITASLDPYTDFIPRKAYKEFQDDTTGHFGGLGIEITLEEESLGEKVLTVITPLAGTPAAEAGILPGDRIVAIEKESTEGMELETAVGKLRGPIGTRVTITIVHKGDSTPIDVTLARGNITLESIKGYAVDPDTGKWNYFVDPESRIGYIRMTDFKEDTPEDLRRAVSALAADGMKALVLDLRFNHGGLLSSGIKTADLFIADGPIVSLRGAHTHPTTWKAHYFNTYGEFPFALLINDQSASAAEILAGALKDHGRAVLVGTKSYGKGTVQTLYELDHGQSALKLTTQKYYTPSGVSIHRDTYSTEGGLTPDYEVKTTDEEQARLAEVWHLRGLKRDARQRLLDMEKELAAKNPEFKIVDPDAFKDPQLDKALELLKTELEHAAASGVAGARG